MGSQRVRHDCVTFTSIFSLPSLFWVSSFLQTLKKKVNKRYFYSSKLDFEFCFPICKKKLETILYTYMYTHLYIHTYIYTLCTKIMTINLGMLITKFRTVSPLRNREGDMMRRIHRKLPVSLQCFIFANCVICKFSIYMVYAVLFAYMLYFILKTNFKEGFCCMTILCVNLTG